MTDVTGRTYEAFVEYLLRRLGYRDEWTSGTEPQYLYEKHLDALCHTEGGPCKHASSCQSLATREGLRYGPWYDPDFFLLVDGGPAACIHVSHWSSPSDSHRKFWRTAEDHFQYKVHFGLAFLSVNLVFVALDPDVPPQQIFDSDKLVSVHGFKPAIGSVLAVSFDSTILFPKEYAPIEAFVTGLPSTVPRSAKKRRQFYNDAWEHLYKTNNLVRKDINAAVKLLRIGLTASPSVRYPSAAIQKLQEVCWAGRQHAVGLHPTETRYRKGLQHAFLIRELLVLSFGNRVDPDAMVWSILTSNPRFPVERFRQTLGAGPQIADSEINAFCRALALIPVQMKKYKPIYLLNNTAGLGQAEWNPDMKQFILGLRHVKSQNLLKFRSAVLDLYAQYQSSYGLKWIFADLFELARVARKVEYVKSCFIGIKDKATFVRALACDMLTPSRIAPHEAVVKDIHNWPPDVLLEFYRLGSMQHITTALPAKFEKTFGHSLRPYSYMNNLGQLVSHLMAGVPVGPFFSKGTKFTQAEFYDAIWPLFAECLWEAIGKRKPLDSAAVELNYRYKKVKRIISSPDLEPIAFLFRRTIPSLIDGPTLRGVFNQLSSLKGWSQAALTTETSGFDSTAGAILHTHSVFGEKHIADKTKELSARMRANQLRCDSAGHFQPESTPGLHFLVVDGDWPVNNKINLLESGYAGVFEIAELDALTEVLGPLRVASEKKK